jgi:hypothetical protein
VPPAPLTCQHSMHWGLAAIIIHVYSSHAENAAMIQHPFPNIVVLVCRAAGGHTWGIAPWRACFAIVLLHTLQCIVEPNGSHRTTLHSARKRSSTKAILRQMLAWWQDVWLCSKEVDMESPHMPTQLERPSIGLSPPFTARQRAA